MHGAVAAAVCARAAPDEREHGCLLPRAAALVRSDSDTPPPPLHLLRGSISPEFLDFMLGRISLFVYTFFMHRVF